MSAQPARILVADDDPDLRDILRSILEPAGFTVSESMDGESALHAIRGEPPDLVIIDYLMPGLTGPEVCTQLKQDLLLRHLPVIMLTGKSEVQDKVHGINAGADDYLIKPFEPKELLARVQMVLRRTSQDLEANPLTRLPGNVTIQRELEHHLAAGGPVAVCYLDLNRFKAFNDHYGFKRGDDVIKRTATVLLETSRASGSPKDFLGHIGGDDFILITTADFAVRLCEAIVRNFDAMVPSLYDESDRARGYMLHTDRKGQQVKTPLLSIAIALVTNEDQVLTHPGQIAELGAELKAYAKQSDRSVYVKERRKVSDK
ncbi:MAG: response regulator [Candidatus Omnitrophota bacterium]|nr:response regulator [Candidatus Omnitrophota bacterium]